jgi:quinol monooxygenase YgiN
MLIIAGHLEVDADRRDDYVAAHRDLLRRGRQAPGCLDLAISADPLSATRVNNFERWETREHLDAIAATRAVLPTMREAGAGTLLYTTGAGSIDPVPQIGNVNAAAAALRNWVINLHKELAGTGVQAAHVAIDVSVDTPAFPGAPTAPAEQIATVYWELHTQRTEAERVFTTETPWATVAPPTPH